MSKEFLNTLSMLEIARRLHDGEKIFNDTDPDAYAGYVGGIGICKFQKKTGELLAMNLTLTLFSHLYFEDATKEDYESMVGCVGWFWDGDEDNRSFGVLSRYCNGDGFPFYYGNNPFKHFRPAKKSELKFWEESDE